MSCTKQKLIHVHEADLVLDFNHFAVEDISERRTRNLRGGFMKEGRDEPGLFASLGDQLHLDAQISLSIFDHHLSQPYRTRRRAYNIFTVYVYFFYQYETMTI